MNKRLKLPEVAKLFNISSKYPVRTIRIYLQRVEEQRNIKILLREGKYKHFYTTLPLLRNAFPELFKKDQYEEDNISFLKKQIYILTNKVTSLNNRILQLENKNGIFVY